MLSAHGLSAAFRTAVLHQAGPVPVIGGIVKPFKPGGYSDSGADLAFALRNRGQTVVTPMAHPSPATDLAWSFPDTPAGIRHALALGANTFWANTTLHSAHALVALRDELVAKDVRVVGQNPLNVEKYEDKAWLNRWLESQEKLGDSFPKRAVLVRKSPREGDLAALRTLGLPAVVKPIRGRGSYGVRMVRTASEMGEAGEELLKESDEVLVEYCGGQEVTVSVMSPGDYTRVGIKPNHWALPVVTRFDHQNGIAPSNGVVAVTANSRALSPAEHEADPEYATLQGKCEVVAALCGARAPIRIDARRRHAGGPFALFDVNMKPNATGPGRPGRDKQASLTAIAAEMVGWEYGELAVNILRQARPLKELLAA